MSTARMFHGFLCVGLGLILIILLDCRRLHSAEPQSVPPPLSLRKAIETGLSRNPLLAAVRFQSEAAGHRVVQARSGFYPEIDVSGSFTRTTNPTAVFGTKLNQESITLQDFDPSRLNDPEPIDNFATIFSARMPLYDRGRIRGGLKQAELALKAAEREEELTQQQVILDVITSYMGVLLARENLKVVEQTLETARAHHAMVRSRFESGLVVKSDLLRADVRIAELEQERLQAESRLAVMRAKLDAAMGTEVGRTYDLVTPLERDYRPPGSLEDWLKKALERRPDLQQIFLQEEIADQEVNIAKAAHLPGLYLSGNYEINTEEFDETGNNYTVGAVMRLNVFSGFRLRAKVREAEAELRRTKSLIEVLEQRIRVETRDAYSRTESAWQRIEVARSAVEQAEEGLRIVRNRYESGLFTIVNLLDAETALQEARTNYLKAHHDYRVAKAGLRLAAGVLDEGFE